MKKAIIISACCLLLAACGKAKPKAQLSPSASAAVATETPSVLIQSSPDVSMGLSTEEKAIYDEGGLSIYARYNDENQTIETRYTTTDNHYLQVKFHYLVMNGFTYPSELSVSDIFQFNAYNDGHQNFSIPYELRGIITKIQSFRMAITVVSDERTYLSNRVLELTSDTEIENKDIYKDTYVIYEDETVKVHIIPTQKPLDEGMRVYVENLTDKKVAVKYDMKVNDDESPVHSKANNVTLIEPLGHAVTDIYWEWWSSAAEHITEDQLNTIHLYMKLSAGYLDLATIGVFKTDIPSEEVVLQ